MLLPLIYHSLSYWGRVIPTGIKMPKSSIFFYRKTYYMTSYNFTYPVTVLCCHDMSFLTGMQYLSLRVSCRRISENNFQLLITEGCLFSCSALQASLNVAESTTRAGVTAITIQRSSCLQFSVIPVALQQRTSLSNVMLCSCLKHMRLCMRAALRSLGLYIPVMKRTKCHPQ